MSETTPDIISASPGLPLDPAPRAVEAPPAIDPRLRCNLMYIGANFSLVMAMKNKMPEVVARETGLPLELVEAARAGSEPDIGVRALSAICSLLGLPFQILVGSAAPTSPAQGNTP